MPDSPLRPTADECRWLLIVLALMALAYVGTNLIETPYTFNWGFP